MDAARPWGEPPGWHKFFGHSSAFIKAFSYLPAGKGVGRGRLLSLRPQQPFRNFFVILVVLRKHYRGLFTGMSQAFPGVGISAKCGGDGRLTKAQKIVGRNTWTEPQDPDNSALSAGSGLAITASLLVLAEAAARGKAAEAQEGRVCSAPSSVISGGLE